MLALENKANWVECKLSQLYKEQQPQEELNAAVEQNRQSRNMLSSYQTPAMSNKVPPRHLKRTFPFEGNDPCP
jgi:hypothetical protein